MQGEVVNVGVLEAMEVTVDLVEETMATMSEEAKEVVSECFMKGLKYFPRMLCNVRGGQGGNH